MNQIQIGKFIADCRKELNMTQLQVAERLGITNRAVSKWETGKSMPDVSIILDLCSTLDITVTELLQGKRIEGERFTEAAEFNILDLLKSEKRLRWQKTLSEALSGGGTGLLLSILINRTVLETPAQKVTAILGCLMIFCGWLYRNKLEKSKFTYPLDKK